MINLHSSTHYFTTPPARHVAGSGAESMSAVSAAKTADAAHASPALDPTRRVQPHSAVSAHSATAKRSPNTSDRAAEPADLQLLKELASRDREVRTHEQAHLAAAGGLANGGAKLSFTRGPDGRQYATGGEVSIDVAPVGNDPQATIDKAHKIRRAALAPSNPSQADRAVAARATAMANEARLELQREARELEQSAAAEEAVNKDENRTDETTSVEAYRSGSEPPGRLVNTAV